ncbi:2Fe-2S iron-sulfur cluster-binding protein [Candidatus Vampirococcus lugosii]|uniref:2Fe-2S ferredoxin-type domain-containing protein n=1 Tax=Candidatus Vampirococcus lugosii TaxID=2789015 RepID=A0ABS5QMS5_9BACT|nr:2Fe-2S iron-sulfur cluster-binding protein [Candidatus Vampirococcus lugosii]MBS8122515.1 hypothetical protein [Candidatus Vampirococcus lugosii]
MIQIYILDNFGDYMKTFEANDKENILKQIINSGFDMPFSCMNGTCGICSCFVIKGSEFLIDTNGNNFVSNGESFTTCNTFVKANLDGKVVLQAVF